MSTSAAEHLSPSFPERAAWGTASKLRACQQDVMDQASAYLTVLVGATGYTLADGVLTISYGEVGTLVFSAAE